MRKLVAFSYYLLYVLFFFGTLLLYREIYISDLATAAGAKHAPLPPLSVMVMSLFFLECTLYYCTAIALLLLSASFSPNLSLSFYYFAPRNGRQRHHAPSHSSTQGCHV